MKLLGLCLVGLRMKSRPCNNLSRFKSSNLNDDGNINDGEIDDIFEEELTWNTGFTYLRPNQYLPVSGFQNTKHAVLNIFFVSPVHEVYW